MFISRTLLSLRSDSLS